MQSAGVGPLLWAPNPSGMSGYAPTRLSAEAKAPLMPCRPLLRSECPVKQCHGPRQQKPCSCSLEGYVQRLGRALLLPGFAGARWLPGAPLLPGLRQTELRLSPAGGG